jgi:hypothetical protein
MERPCRGHDHAEEIEHIGLVALPQFGDWPPSYVLLYSVIASARKG